MTVLGYLKWTNLGAEITKTHGSTGNASSFAPHGGAMEDRSSVSPLDGVMNKLAGCPWRLALDSGVERLHQSRPVTPIWGKTCRQNAQKSQKEISILVFFVLFRGHSVFTSSQCLENYANALKRITYKIDIRSPQSVAKSVTPTWPAPVPCILSGPGPKTGLSLFGKCCNILAVNGRRAVRNRLRPAG
jgi:hypothetical protein